MLILAAMLVLGFIVGFVGAGGSGFMIAVLITFFHIPIHTALATGMAAMFFTVMSGAYSHIREGNIDTKVGITVGLFGALGAYGGTRMAQHIPGNQLLWMSAGMLFLSAVLIWYRTKRKDGQQEGDSLHAAHANANLKVEVVPFFLLKAITIGLVTGTMSGTFGIGSAPFIQLSLTALIGNSLRRIAGTTMMVILPIALLAAIGYNQSGFLDYTLLVQVVAGTMLGTYIGAKFTRRAPQFVLRTAMILTPIISGMLMIW